MEKPIWVGMDVHARTIMVASLEDRSTTPTVTEIENDPKAIRRLFTKLKKEGQVRACYEAGGTGYELYRQLSAMQVDCTVIAPSLMPKKPGDRIKTDRRDAEKLARYFRAGELTAVTVPSKEQETARDILRLREDLRRARTHARHQLGGFLLRHGRRFPGTNWTDSHLTWLSGLEFTAQHERTVFEHYLSRVHYYDGQIASLDGEIDKLAQSADFKTRVDRLVCLRGISTLSAMVILTELFDLRRFQHPRELMAYLGLVPGERSSGDSRRRGRITKTGNGHVRRIFVEAAWSYRHRPLLSARARRALRGQPQRVVDISHRALQRLSTRYGRLVARGRATPHACTAVARELCGFVWAIGQVN